MPARETRTIPTAAALDAIDAIGERRARCDDPGRAALPAAPRDEGVATEPLEVAEYVLGHTRVPRRVLAADVLDALLLVEFSRLKVPATPGTLDFLEFKLLTLGMAAGLSLTEMAVPLGVKHRQTVEQRMVRYASGMRGADRTPHAERAARKEKVARRAWLRRNGPGAVRNVDLLLAHSDDLDRDDARDLAYIKDLLPEPAADTYPDRFGHLMTRVLLVEDVPQGPAYGPLRALRSSAQSWRALG
jgi:hypothetical protein